MAGYMKNAIESLAMDVCFLRGIEQVDSQLWHFLELWIVYKMTVQAVCIAANTLHPLLAIHASWYSVSKVSRA